MSFKSRSKTFTDLINDVYYKHCQDYTIYQQKINIRQKLYDLIRDHFHEEFDLFIVGSSQTQFALNYSDLDLCLVLYDRYGNIDETFVQNKYKTINKLVEIQKIVQSNNLCTDYELISKAIVPIFKFTFNSDLNISVDLNINRTVTIFNTFLLTCYKLTDYRVAPLVVSVKSWARKFGINSSYHNTLSSYNLTLMVIHYLQNGCYPAVLPRLQSLISTDFFCKIHSNGALEDSLLYVSQVVNNNFTAMNHSTVGELFSGFIHYYNQPDIFNHVISIRQMFGQRKLTSRSYISIEDPFELKNTAYSVYMRYKYEQIKNAFRLTHESIKNGTFSSKNSNYFEN